MNFVAIIVTYNRKELLKKNITCLLNQSYKDFDILIIDNHSTDNTKSYISDFLDNERISYVDTGDNLGGAGGFQFGIKEALKGNYDYVWLMDDDSMPRPEALMNLVSYIEKNKEFGFLSSKVLWKDNELCSMNIQRESLTKNVSDFTYEVIPIVIASFVSLLVPVEVIKEIGLPIKEFFIWTDDWEYTRRISRKYDSYLITDSEVVHETNTNNGANIATDCEERIERYKYAYRNEVYLYRREGVKGFLHILLRTPLHIARVLRYSRTKKLYRIGIIIKSTLEGIWFKPEIEFWGK